MNGANVDSVSSPTVSSDKNIRKPQQNPDFENPKDAFDDCIRQTF